jgi:hypothetical protein
MSTDDAAPYELHLLETPTLQSERYLWHDPVQAVLSYNRLALEARRPAVLTKGRTLEGEAAEIIATYSPSDSAPPIRYRLTTAQPAFTEPRETDLDRLHRKGREERVHAANWYARGFIDCIGGLSPFDSVDAAAFAEWHADSEGYNPIDEQWATWSAQRRQEKGL